jgi:hypothetical protein
MYHYRPINHFGSIGANSDDIIIMAVPIWLAKAFLKYPWQVSSLKVDDLTFELKQYTLAQLGLSMIIVERKRSTLIAE